MPRWVDPDKGPGPGPGQAFKGGEEKGVPCHCMVLLAGAHGGCLVVLFFFSPGRNMDVHVNGSLPHWMFLTGGDELSSTHVVALYYSSKVSKLYTTDPRY